MADEDPMAYLNAKRQEMAAMAEMAAVAQMQSDLARNVAQRMDKINALLEESPTTTEAKSSASQSTGAADAEVDYWRHKVQELSEPVAGSGAVAPLPSFAPLRNGRLASKTEASAGAVQGAEAKLSWEGTSSFNDDQHAPVASSSAKRRQVDRSTRGSKQAFDHAQAKPTLPDLAPSAKLQDPATPPSFRHKSPNSNGDRGGGDGGGGGVIGDDNEVAYWRRKIAELSAADPTNRNGPGGSGAQGGGYHSTRLPSQLSPSLSRVAGQPPPQRLNLSNPRYKAKSLADEPLSWEGTASFADENKENPGGSSGGNSGAPPAPGRRTPAKAEEKRGHADDDDDEDILLAAQFGEGLQIQEKK